MTKNILAAAVLAACATYASAFTPFAVKDIRVEGVQRTEAGTVFSYLPIRIGDRVDEEAIAKAVKALYATGFYRDVRIEAEGETLVVSVDERPAIAQIGFAGNKEFDEATLRKGLKDAGIAESRIFDRSVLERAEQELKRLYLSRSMYAMQIRTTVSPLERNRVAVNFEITEGVKARIKSIRLIGVEAFSESRILDQMNLQTTGMWSWFFKDDQYSKQALQADLETIRSYYLNRGYLDFAIQSSQVSITSDKQDVHISIAIKEGAQYRVSGVKLAGELLVPEAELQSLIDIRAGDVFSREKLNETSRKLANRLGNEGYAFANVNPAPEVDRDKREVALTFFIDPGRRAYVNRINIAGNAKTRDEVVRREFRQPEGAWFDRSKVERSRERLVRTSFFEDVAIDTVPVAGTTDQVDLNVEIKEKPTGSITLGAGYSQTEKLVLSGSISQDNVFGSGNALSLSLSTGKINRNVALAYTNPYFTEDGVSAGVDVYNRRVDPTSQDTLAKYKSESTGAGVRIGVPLSEERSLQLGLSFDHTRIETQTDSPDQYKDYVAKFGKLSTTLLLNAGWADDGRDSLFYPTKGFYQRISADVAIPPAELRYARINYQVQRYFPLSQTFTLLLNGDVAYGVGMSGRAYPFFKNFYAGGIGTVRGFEENTLGPSIIDMNGSRVALGGSKRLTTNAEILFPMPGLKENSKSVRMNVFVDGGYVWGADQGIRLADLRYSTGVGLTWVSPIGPLKFSFAVPLKKKEDDQVRRFQFQIGQLF